MDSRSQAPQKSSSFSSAQKAAPREVDRNLSLGSLRHPHGGAGAGGDLRGGGYHPSASTEQIREEDEEAEEEEEDRNSPGVSALSGEVDAFVSGDLSVPESSLERFAAAVELQISRSEAKVRGGGGGGAGDRLGVVDAANGEPPALLAAIARLAALSSALAKVADPGKYGGAAQRVGGVMQRAMAVLDDEFHALLDLPKKDTCKLMRRPPSFEQQQQQQATHEADRCVLRAPPPSAAAADSCAAEPAPPYPPETVDRLRCIADAMASAGRATECAQMFLAARRSAFDGSLRHLGYEKPGSAEDVARMTWEALESEIATWIKAFRHAINVGLSTEHDLCLRVFSSGVGRAVFADLARCVMLQMLGFTDAVAATKRSAERLFKVLDMYEAVRDASPVVDAFFLSDSGDSNNALSDLKSEIAAVRSRLGESAVAMFRELESSIRADAGRQPVPGGAVHPLTRYVMNYLKYTCEYNATLEQVFRDHAGHGAAHGPDSSSSENNNPFAAQLMDVMELLHSNLEGKSRLYKDPALSSIFLMNNGRYMLQKIRGSPETNAVLGEAWARKQSTSLRQYHKNYQRETWSRVLTLLRDDGVLTVKGHVQKPMLKERFKQFNAAMDEIQRTQGAWVVSDEQLQSELRVSIAAVVVPAYRSFLGRFGQTFSAGRQAEKYVKLSAEDLEGIIDELFDGNPSSMSRRRT
ncbi:exocyst complex component EXO70B1 [Brachypodium distachyon]|uniref:Exocyst subunit Exo70 family protein n=1 Tax=Brachypodium distachyon TaxID=15368 RepID=I1IU36_BRADI|nr:exocyst complex component EXO70B1 [Brachypodium distachyon]KQJ92115.1 hypothetical protein BRADI_4g41750v3 [Brachypodium distachyon]|eukprot:XP_014757710.1 exocyst complex component EXO70B1 [Brachypodium distachyon]